MRLVMKKDNVEYSFNHIDRTIFIVPMCMHILRDAFIDCDNIYSETCL